MGIVAEHRTLGPADPSAPVVDELHGVDTMRWDGFVRGQPDALPHHLLGWRDVFQTTYGFRPRYLVAKRDGQIVGVMPLFEVRSLIQGHHFTTLPGGVCAASEEAGRALIERAKQMVVSTKARFLAIRDTRRRWAADLVTHDTERAVLVDVSQGTERTRTQLPNDIRQRLKRALASDAEVRRGGDQLDEFYHAFAIASRRRGTPVVPRAIFANTLATFPSEAMLLGLWHDGQLIGGSLTFLLGRSTHGIVLFARDESLNLNPNHLMFWSRIEYAVAHDCRWLDLGRSQVGSGPHRFKLRWGKEEVPVYQQFFLHRAQKMPTVAADVRNGKGRLLVRAWQRLPLRITRVLGPRIRRELPFA